MIYEDIIVPAGHAVVSFSEELWLGALRITKSIPYPDSVIEQAYEFEADFEFKEVWHQNREFIELILRAIYTGYEENGPLVTAASIILKNYYDTYPECALKKLETAAIREGVYIATKYYIRQRLATAIAIIIIRRIVEKVAIETVIGATKHILNVVIIAGIIEEASQAAERLRKQHPKIYMELRERRLEMIYFLLEKPLHKYLANIMSYELNPIPYQNKMRKKLCSEL